MDSWGLAWFEQGAFRGQLGNAASDRSFNLESPLVLKDSFRSLVLPEQTELLALVSIQ